MQTYTFLTSNVQHVVQLPDCLTPEQAYDQWQKQKTEAANIHHLSRVRKKGREAKHKIEIYQKKIAKSQMELDKWTAMLAKDGANL